MNRHEVQPAGRRVELLSLNRRIWVIGDFLRGHAGAALLRERPALPPVLRVNVPPDLSLALLCFVRPLEERHHGRPLKAVDGWAGPVEHG